MIILINTALNYTRNTPILMSVTYVTQTFKTYYTLHMYENLKYKINYGYVYCVQDIFHNLHSL